MKHVTILLAATMLFATGCDDKPADPKSDPAPKADAAADAAGDTKPAAAKEDAGTTCKALVGHIVDMQEASKKDGLINRKNLDKMVGRCEKAANLGANKDAVACAMKAKDHAEFVKCDGFGKVLAPW